MPNWISKDGVFHPAKEKVALVNNSKKAITNPSEEGTRGFGQIVEPGEPFIYEGPDRAAMFALFQAKQETLGMDFHTDADLINRVRQLGYKSVDEYAKVMGYDKVKVEEDFKAKASVIVKHDLPQRVKELNIMGGGSDTSGSGADIIGGFGEERVRPASELE